MLTTTYSLIVFSAEQNGFRARVASLREQARQAMAAAVTDEHVADAVLTQLNDFHAHAQCRKVEVHLVRRMRAMNRYAASLLAELESLGLLSLNILRSIRDRLALAIGQAGQHTAELEEAVELYCATVLQKLDKEETELFPMASRVLTDEDWFQIARQLLTHEGKIAAIPRDKEEGKADRSDMASAQAAGWPDQAVPYSAIDGRDQRSPLRPFAHAARLQQCVSWHAAGAAQDKSAAASRNQFRRQA